jgi:hypothetical protein
MNPLGDRRKRQQQTQTVYGIFEQACWAQYGDEAGIEEFHIQCSDWWEDLAERQEKFETLADRSNATIPTTTVLLSSHSHKLYRTGCNSGPEQNQTSTVLFRRQQHEATLDAGEKSGNFSTLYADEKSGSVSTPTRSDTSSCPGGPSRLRLATA